VNAPSATSRVPLVEVAKLLAPGQPLPFRVLDGSGRLLLAVGQRILDARQLTALLERGACVEYAEAQAVRQARASGAAAAGFTPSTRKRTWFDRLEQQTWALDSLLRLLGRDPALVTQIEAFADEHIALIQRHPDAALFVCVRQDDRRFALYALTHALHTSTVVMLTARQMGWTAQTERTAVLASLTMNVSITELQARMAEQTDPPGKKQMEQIRAHPQASAQKLRDSGVTDGDWLAAVEQHHERADGSGYPHGLVEVSDIARVVRAADVFTAKISPRALRVPLPPQVAARQLFQEEKGGPVAAALIKAIGIYPPGDLVRLKNGEAAIVVQRAASGNTPPVAALLAANGKPLPGAPRRDTAEPEFAITGPLTDRTGLPRVLPEQLYGVLEG
jgi:HD-GYP domain-containing protein (c-di-GMP phosphodiesterase class II)